MGDIAEYYMDLAMQQDVEMEAENHFRRELIEKLDKDYMMGILKWNTQFDGKIMVTKMTKLHIENTINYIKRTYKNEEVSEKWIELLGYELEKRK